MSLKTFLILVIAFIAAIIVGTLSHECGHWIVAAFQGFDARISYGAKHYIGNPEMSYAQSLWMSAGGPLQTMLTGTIGVLLSLRIPRSIERLSTVQWTIVFLALFWLRQSANLVVGSASLLLSSKQSIRGDEIRLAYGLGLPGWSLALVTGLIGFGVLYYITFRVIPRQQRITFLAAGLIGGVLGYILWLHLLGPVIMP